MKKTLLALAIALTSGLASAAPIMDCPDGSTNCSLQNMGDLSTTTENTQVENIQSGSGYNSMGGNNSIDTDIHSMFTPENKADTKSSAVGNTSSNRNDNNSNSSSGGNNLAAGSFSGGNTVKGGNTSSSMDNNTLAGGKASSNSGGNKQNNNQRTNTRVNDNSKLNLDASDRSTHSSNYTDKRKTIIHANLTQPAIPVAMPSANISTIGSQCGYRVIVSREPVYGHFIGLIKTKKIFLGYNDTVEEDLENQYTERYNPDGTVSMIGHQVLMNSTVLTASGARQLGGGHASGGGSMTQLGSTSASGMQTIVTSVQILSCEIARFDSKSD